MWSSGRGRRRAAVLITDLDNTLYDWVGAWYASFSALLQHLVSSTGISRELLIEEIRAVHQRHRTCEYAFLLEELPSLLKQSQGRLVSRVFADSIQIYRDARQKKLALYPDVKDTLARIRAAGSLVVGYTESMALYTNYRMRHLGLDSLLDYLYSPAGHDIPANLSPEAEALFPATPYVLEHAIHRYTPEGALKPNAAVLRSIVADVGASAADCVYVGDSLMKDIAMASEAGITAVHAKYGQAHETTQYELLKAVTHWSAEDVEREKLYTEGVADYTLNRSFGELIQFIEFCKRD